MVLWFGILGSTKGIKFFPLPMARLPHLSQYLTRLLNWPGQRLAEKQVASSTTRLARQSTKLFLSGKKLNTDFSTSSRAPDVRSDPRSSQERRRKEKASATGRTLWASLVRHNQCYLHSFSTALKSELWTTRTLLDTSSGKTN